MVSFADLWEQIENKKKSSPLMNSGEDERSLITVRIGKEMHDKDEISFWDEFISLCGSTEGLSQLLGVSREKILSWPARIQEMLQKLDQHTADSPSEKRKQEVVPTGENGAFISNQDPTNIGDMT
jgi:hypothetical protein